MSLSNSALLKKFWPEVNTRKPTFKEFEPSPLERKTIAGVFKERNCKCALCGRADFENFEFSLRGSKNKPIEIHAYCLCGYRVGFISRASLIWKKTTKEPLPMPLMEFLELAQSNRLKET